MSLINKVKDEPCVACGQMGVDAHHVTTRAAGGKDTEDNLMPLCRQHHTEWHRRGPGAMIKTYKRIETWLETHGRDDIFRKASR